ncbi:MAG: DUF952 domain-containing protein [Chloroflexota bacterium]
MTRYTFHYTPVEYFDSRDPGEDYTPPDFEREGFIHCTDGAQNMANTGNRHYRQDARDFYMLYIDKERVQSEIKYEDPGRIYPHIYGPLNRDAIVDKKLARRERDGTFLVMPEYEA